MSANDVEMKTKNDENAENTSMGFSEKRQSALVEIRKLCGHTGFDVPFFKILDTQCKVLDGMLGDGIPEVTILLTPFNELLEQVPRIAKLTQDEGYAQQHEFLVEAMGTFVLLSHCQINVFRRSSQNAAVKAARECLQAVTDTVSFMAPKIAEACLELPYFKEHPIVAKILCSFRELAEPLDSKIIAEQNRNLPQNIVTAFERGLSSRNATDEFYKLLDSIIDKLRRYCNQIGPNVRLGELIRDYDRWMKEYEGKFRVFRSCPKTIVKASERLAVAASFDEHVSGNPLLMPQVIGRCEELSGLVKGHGDNPVLLGIGIGIGLLCKGIPSQDMLLDNIGQLLDGFDDLEDMTFESENACRRLHVKTIGRLSKLLLDQLSENRESGVFHELLSVGLQIIDDYRALLDKNTLGQKSFDRVNALIDSISYHDHSDSERFIRQSGIQDRYEPSSFSSAAFSRIVVLFARHRDELGKSRRAADMVRRYAKTLHEQEIAAINLRYQSSISDIREAFATDIESRRHNIGKSLGLEEEIPQSAVAQFLKGWQEGDLPKWKKRLRNCSPDDLISLGILSIISVLIYAGFRSVVLHFTSSPWAVWPLRIIGLVVLSLAIWSTIAWIWYGIVWSMLAWNKRSALKAAQKEYHQSVQKSERDRDSRLALADSLDGSTYRQTRSSE